MNYFLAVSGFLPKEWGETVLPKITRASPFVLRSWSPWNGLDHRTYSHLIGNPSSLGRRRRPREPSRSAGVFFLASRHLNAISTGKLEEMGLLCFRTRSIETIPKGNCFIGPLKLRVVGATGPYCLKGVEKYALNRMRHCGMRLSPILLRSLCRPHPGAVLMLVREKIAWNFLLPPP